MSNSPEQRTNYALAAAICLVLAIALGASGFDQYFKTPLLESGDVAVNAIQVDNAKHLSELYGNYSRFEFNHPGPAFFYAYAVGEWLLYDLLGVVPSPGNAHLLACMFVQSAFFSLALVLIASHLRSRLWLPLALLAAALYFGPLREPFMSIWPPHVLLMPFLCLLAAACSVGTGRLGHLPLLVLAGGFLFHGHVAQPLFVGALGVLSLWLGLRRARQDEAAAGWRELVRRHPGPVWASLALATLFLLPLAIDVLTGGTRSNVATILGRFYANTGDSKSVLQSFLYFVSFATPAQNQEDIFTEMGPQVGAFFNANAGRVALWTAIFALTPCLAFVLPRRVEPAERRFLLTAHLLLGFTVFLCVLWGMAQAGPMAQFNGYFYYAVYFFALLLALGWLDRLIRAPGNPALAGALCAIAAVISTWAFRLPRWSESDAGQPIKRAVDAAVKPGDRSPRILVFEHASWPKVASLALDLQRRGVKFYMEPWWGFMFGYGHNLYRLGPTPEDAAAVWWITEPGEGGIRLSPELMLYTTPAPLRPGGDEIRFGGHQNAFRYVVSGITAGNVDYAWSWLPRLVLVFAPQPADRDVKLTFDVESGVREQNELRPQPAIVSFNGKEIGRLIATERGPHAITIPQALWNSQPRGKLELKFPEAVPNRSYKRPRHQWWNAWGIWAIRVGPA
jgi:hypothetical protein